ncbi:MAG: DUF1648 domain-containing protein [Halohasta sp.]
MLSRRVSAGLSLGLVVLTAAAGVALWPRLPAEMAIHFSATGTPDNSVSKPLAVFLMPAIMLGTLAVLAGALRVDPPEDPHIPAVTAVSTMGFMAAIQGLVLAWNLGYPVPFDLVIGGAVLWVLALTGYVTARERGWSLA